MSAAWGPAGSALAFTGASGREWDLTFASPLGPSPSASAVWLVRNAAGGPPLAAKRIFARPGRTVDDIVDDAAVWRAACLASPGSVVELVDVYVDRVAGAGNVTCLMGYAGKGHVPRGGKLDDKGVLHLIVALCDVVRAVADARGVHGNIAGGSVMLDADGRVKVGGFGGEGGARGREDGGEGGDMWDVGVYVYGVCFKGVASADGGGWAAFPESHYGDAVLGILWEMLAPGDDTSMEYASVDTIRDMAVEAGGRADGVVSRGGVSAPQGAGAGEGVVGSGEGLPPGAADAVERAVDKLVDGVDVGGAYSVVLGAVKGSAAGGDAVFSALFRCPISRDPIVAFRAMGMLHNLMLDGGEDMLDCVRRNERFMEWAQSSWTAEATRKASRPGDGDSHASCFCFVGGEIAYFSALLRRKAKFHMLSAGAFTGSWERTHAKKEDGRCVIAARRRKVVGGIADLVEMASELGVLLATAADVEAAVKHAGLRSLVDECARAHEAVIVLAEECQTVDGVEKLVSGYERVWKAAKALIVAVRVVPAAGGAEWEESLAGDGPRQIAAEAEMRLEDEVLPDMSELVLDSAFEKETKEEKAERKGREREERREARRAEKAARKAAEAAEKEALTAADSALVVHGAGDEAMGKVKTMFGDLLGGVDTGGAPTHVPGSADPRPDPGLSDAAALAAAFGASPEAVDGQFLALPAPGGDDGSDDGGYETYQARQEEDTGRQERQRQERSTGAWAARAGYGGMALVTTGLSTGGLLAVPGKKHPVFCQCLQCQEAEAQQAATMTAARAADGYSDDGRDDGDQYINGRNYDDDGGYGGGGGVGDNGSYAGSYESVDYAIENRGSGRDYDSLSDDGGGKAPVFAMPPPGHSSRANDPSASEPGPSSGLDSRKKDLSRKSPSLPQSLVVNMKRLRLGDKIGEGSFGIVYQGEYERKTVAIKKMHKQLQKNSAALKEFSYEVGLMCELKHANLLGCIAAKLTAPDVLLVTEFMKRGTLFDVLYRDRIRLTTALIRKIALQVAEGLAYLHERGYLHRDLKSSNVLVDGSYNVKLGDFGLSKDQSGSNEAAAGGLSGTIQYLSPECLRGEPQTPKSDVYAYGLILWECWAGEPPYVGVDAMVAARQVLDDGLRPTIPSHCSRSYAAIIQSCWASSPAARPTFTRVIDMIKTTTK